MRVQIINMIDFYEFKARPVLDKYQVMELYHYSLTNRVLEATRYNEYFVDVNLKDTVVRLPMRFIRMIDIEITPEEFEQDFISSGCIVNTGKNVLVKMSSDRTDQGISNTLRWASPNCKIGNSQICTDWRRWYQVTLDFDTSNIVLTRFNLRY